ncbi:MAG: HupE/UreJ family protein [Vicinamibacterales bacterium]
MRRLLKKPCALVSGLVLAGWMATAGVEAHDLSRSTSRLVVDGRRVDVTFTIGARDFHSGPVVDADGDERVSIDEVDAAIPGVFAALKQHLAITADGAPPVSVLLDRYALSDGPTIRMDLTYEFAATVGTLALGTTLPEVTQSDHRHLASVVRGGASAEAVLDLNAPHAVFDAAGPGVLASARRFAALGVEHIVTGYDHLAFLAALLLGAAAFRSVVGIVTAFTLAHSLTLGLATFDIVTVPPALVESLIALSIAWVAVENLLLDRPAHRWRLAFAFGLVHGFGFSNVLRDLALPQAALAASLFTFNLGVELGQLAFVALAFPVLRSAMASRWRAPVGLAASSAVLCLGVYWFVQRLLLA